MKPKATPKSKEKKEAKKKPKRSKQGAELAQRETGVAGTGGMRVRD
jgi:hypothetical protein